MTPRVDILILNWNNAPDTLACVEACRQLTGVHAQITVIDNGSNDDSWQLLQQCAGVTLLQTGANLGFAGGNNVGIRHALEAGADYIWLLNNDAVADPQALTVLVDALENDPHAAIAGSKIFFYDEPRKIWFAGGTWSKARLRLRQRGACQQDEGQFDKLCAVGSVSGCSLLIRATAINKIGLMDEDYFLYWEDTDWCARASKSGYTILFVPASQVWHKVSTTVKAHSELQYYYVTRNGIKFCCRHDLYSLPVFLCYVTADVLCGCLQGNFAKLSGYGRGIIDFLCGKSGQKKV